MKLLLEAYTPDRCYKKFQRSIYLPQTRVQHSPLTVRINKLVHNFNHSFTIETIISMYSFFVRHGQRYSPELPKIVVIHAFEPNKRHSLELPQILVIGTA
jgi:hypothetical protein